MLIYVIPLVILIIVLLVFKKRQDAQAVDQAKTKTVKAKKPATASKVTPQKTKVVEPVTAKKTVTPLSDDTRKKIETLIQERNFFSAEANINQALNRDNSQHELYLLLLDIHILQKDEFAISQLINHIRSLELDDILTQAEAKQSEYAKAANAVQETIDFQSVQPQTVTAQDNAAAQSAFDSLVAPTPSNEQAFEQLQQELQPGKPAVAPEPVPDIQPLEFNFEPAIAAAKTLPVEDTSAPAANSLDFNFQDAAPVEDIKSTPEAASEPAPGLDFKLELEPAANVEPTVVTPSNEEIQPLDFSFSLDTPATEAEKTTEPQVEFDLSNLTTPVASEVPAETSGLDFKFDNPEPEKPVPAATVVNFEIPAPPAPVATDQGDPLVQSFPELSEVNEAELNLELAEQYIQLGAYAAAREVIAESENEYSPEQQQQAEQLLNRIAS
ncbi:fimbrial protein FimV [Acinetobacter sp. RF14B]|uniref:fimbrial protein FimV n=1 Tax=Acinetobacter sp. RF14B TaxID=2650965 RepID=UPI00116C2EFD|nr:fimbrial protein FimV [Acinetobacter sp. RF14B]TQR68157.1 fimbrial protein FimV [Acinetobacter sp. RF14B]